MIPKIIHYCWFGGKKKPKSVKKCIRSWKKYCPDFKIIEWNESNSLYLGCKYSREAYECKKWAFVSDFVRVQVLYEYGGIYMDTDYELVRPIDVFLSNLLFAGFETETKIAAGIIGCHKGNKLFKKWLEDYHKRSFYKKDGVQDLTTIVSYFTKMFVNEGIKLNNTYQNQNGLVVYPTNYFYPMNYINKKKLVDSETYGIHHYDASWLSGKEKILFKMNPKLINVLVKIKHFFTGAKKCKT